MKKIISFMLGLLWVFAVSFPTMVTAAGSVEDIGIKYCTGWVCEHAFDYEKLMGIENDSNGKRTAITLLQDIVLWATYLVWTILTIVLIYCGISYIFAASGKSSKVSSLKQWMINAWIWALLVRWSYAIVRFIQYVAKW